jgi:hypothetical protein
MIRLLRTALLGAASLVSLLPVSPPVARAEQFDVTGTLDCGIRSGRECQFPDWSTGPELAVFTKDISGNLDRVILDASWVRDRLTDFGQDDFVWFTVDDGVGPDPHIISVVEHRCNPDGSTNTDLTKSCKRRESKKED